MTEWRGMSTDDWIDAGVRMCDAWDEYCARTGQDPEAIDPEHVEHHVFEAWLEEQDKF